MARYELYRKYFLHQCEHHPDLNHSEENGNRVFEVIDIEDALGDFRTGAKEKSYIFRLINYTYSVGDDAEHEVKKTFTGGFLIAKYFDIKNTGKAALYSAMNDSEKVMDEFIEKMISDSQNGHPLFNYSFDSRQQINIQPALQVNPSYAGWLITFSWSDHFRICLTDPSAPIWVDGGQTPFEL